MKNSIKFMFTFVFGAAIGVVATQKFFKIKYETIAQEEIDSVKEVYSKKNKIENKRDNTISIEEFEECKKIMDNLGYSNTNMKGGSESMNEEKYIEVIPPDEYGENEDYDLISLNYYSDGILTDDLNDPIEDIEKIIGQDALDSFGEWEDDAVYVRNDERKCYYEILKDLSKYSDPSVDA